MTWGRDRWSVSTYQKSSLDLKIVTALRAFLRSKKKARVAALPTTALAISLQVINITVIDIFKMCSSLSLLG